MSALDCLTEWEYDLLSFRFGRRWTLGDTAAAFDLTRGQVRKAEVVALRRIARSLFSARGWVDEEADEEEDYNPFTDTVEVGAAIEADPSDDGSRLAVLLASATAEEPSPPEPTDAELLARYRAWQRGEG